jgi:DNA polymerase-3 subunit gamma/tau
VAGKQIPQGLRIIQQLVLDGASLTEFCHQVVEHLRGIMVLQMAQDPALLPELPTEMVRQMQGQAQRLALPTTVAAVKRFSEAIHELKGSYQPQLPLELAFIEAVNGVMVAAPATLTAEIAGAVTPATATSAPPVTSIAPSAKPAVTAPGKSKPAAATGNQPATPPVEVEPPPLDQAAIKKLREQWKALQAQIRTELGHKVLAAFNCVRDIAVSEKGVAFAFGNNAFAQQMISQTENHSRIVAILSDFLGRPVQLECQLGEQAKLARPLATDELQNGDVADPLIEYAVSNLGAKVVEDEE